MRKLESGALAWAFGLVVAVGVVPRLNAQDAEAERKLAETRQAVEQKHAARLIELARKCTKDEDVLKVLALDSARRLDGKLVAESDVRDPPMPEERRAGMLAFAIMAERVQDGVERTPPTLRSMDKLAPVMREIAVARHEAAKDMLPLVAGYRALGRDEDAFAVAKICRWLHRATAREAYRDTGAIIAERRYEATTKPYLERLLRWHEKIGRSKGWQLRGMTIQPPPPDAENAALLAVDKVKGDYTIEAEVQFAEHRGALMLVVAYVDAKNYCGLEYEHASLRLVHVKGGQCKVLESTAVVPNPDDEWFPMRVRVEGGVMSTDAGLTPCKAALPIPVGDGVRCGLMRPGNRDREEKKRDAQPILVRNFFVQ
jgi:hypothetical protein